MNRQVPWHQLGEGISIVRAMLQFEEGVKFGNFLLCATVHGKTLCELEE